MSPSQKQRQVEKEALEELFDLDVHGVTVGAPVTSANTISCHQSCDCGGTTDGCWSPISPPRLRAAA
jgi:hypothetical protein